ncbi:MAG: PD-(D/E)XK nuclease family protein [Rubellimicrobium sp.]|nr:PD-(D/E)XK nuclease family protein [Rubellimicrobium sp.]
MSALDPLVTAHPLTGAFRPVTPDLLAQAYLVPLPDTPDIAALLAARDAPWADSLAVAPAETIAAVRRGLRQIASATARITPDEVDLSRLDPASRLHRHVSALTALWCDHPEVLPDDLRIAAHVIAAAPADALEPLPLVSAAPLAFATPAERGLQAALIAHHGLAEDDRRAAWADRQAPLSGGGPVGSSLNRVQQGLTGGGVLPGPLDESLRFVALRDVAEEAAFAAARAQALIDGGERPQDIGLLVPDEAPCHLHLDRAFRDLVLPLSGLPRPPQRRDVAGETLLHLLLCLQRPAPAMALASLYISPLMPWPAATGRALAGEVMRGRFEPNISKELKGRARDLFARLRREAGDSGKALRAALETAIGLLGNLPDQQDDVLRLRAGAVRLWPLLQGPEEPDWPRLLALVTPETPEPPPTETFVEGVTVITETALPWRPVRHLIALGMSGNRWPRPVPTSPFFLDSELVRLRALTGLQIETRGDMLRLRLERLRRQVLAATGTLTLTRPVFAADGTREAPAPALSLIARTILLGDKPVEDAEVLIHDLRDAGPQDWPCAHRAIPPLASPLVLPPGGALSVDRDLLSVRRDDDGRMRPQSPSRLETLLVSPLAWALAEFGAEETLWAPEGLDVMLAGTLAHDVLEHMFPKDTALPDPEAIAAALPGHLSRAIRRHAPFLQRAIWEVERQGLARDIRTAALAWRDTLAALGAEVIDNELWLIGEGLDIRLRGRADCLLRLPDGTLLVVDHKKSGTTRRRKRMEAGWDLQVALYRAMLLRPEPTGGVLDKALEAAPAIGVAYHLMNDQGVLTHGIELPEGTVSVLPGEVSDQAEALLAARLAEVGAGLIRLNGEDDRTWFDKTGGVTAYALDASPLIARTLGPGLSLPDTAPDTAPDMTEDVADA